MRKAGEVLNVILGENFAEKAQGYSKFFNSWTDLPQVFIGVTGL